MAACYGTPMHGSAEKSSDELGSDIPERDAYQPDEVARRLGGISVRWVWTLMTTGELPSFKLGRYRMVAAEDLKAVIDKLREEDRQAREAAREAVSR